MAGKGKSGTPPSMSERYAASMVLSAVADALGYCNGDWEFTHWGRAIHEDLKEKGGLDKLYIKYPDWIVSDDTVMHLAIADALVNKSLPGCSKEELYNEIVVHYIKCVDDMAGRAPGPTCLGSIFKLKPDVEGGTHLPFNKWGGGCGAAMRGMCIGLRYHRPEDLEDLIAVSIESGRMTHHHPTGYLGSMAAALFTAYAIQEKPPKEWGVGLLSVLHRAKQYIITEGREVEKNVESWGYFTEQWEAYLKLRGITDGQSEPVFPEDYSVEARDAFYKSVSFRGLGGSSGHDAPMIAYDALLGAGNCWIEFCLRGVLHGGDNDSTGAIGGAWFGALYGFHEVPSNHYSALEYRKRLGSVAEKLLEISQPSTPPTAD